MSTTRMFAATLTLAALMAPVATPAAAYSGDLLRAGDRSSPWCAHYQGRRGSLVSEPRINIYTCFDTKAECGRWFYAIQSAYSNTLLRKPCARRG